MSLVGHLIDPVSNGEFRVSFYRSSPSLETSFKLLLYFQFHFSLVLKDGKLF